MGIKEESKKGLLQSYAQALSLHALWSWVGAGKGLAGRVWPIRLWIDCHADPHQPLPLVI